MFAVAAANGRIYFYSSSDDDWRTAAFRQVACVRLPTPKTVSSIRNICSWIVFHPELRRDLPGDNSSQEERTLLQPWWIVLQRYWP